MEVYKAHLKGSVGQLGHLPSSSPSLQGKVVNQFRCDNRGVSRLSLLAVSCNSLGASNCLEQHLRSICNLNYAYSIRTGSALMPLHVQVGREKRKGESGSYSRLNWLIEAIFTDSQAE